MHRKVANWEESTEHMHVSADYLRIRVLINLTAGLWTMRCSNIRVSLLERLRLSQVHPESSSEIILPAETKSPMDSRQDVGAERNLQQSASTPSLLVEHSRALPRSWQLWLSPRPLQRTNTSAQSAILAEHGAALFEFKKDDDGSWVVVETHYMDNKLVREGQSGPPLSAVPLQSPTRLPSQCNKLTQRDI